MNIVLWLSVIELMNRFIFELKHKRRENYLSQNEEECRTITRVVRQREMTTRTTRIEKGSRVVSHQDTEFDRWENWMYDDDGSIDHQLTKNGWREWVVDRLDWVVLSVVEEYFHVQSIDSSISMFVQRSAVVPHLSNRQVHLRRSSSFSSLSK